jgi:hypothetical protein
MLPIVQRRRRSARETFAACRLKYAEIYVRGADMGSAATIRGQVIHDAQATYVNHLFADKLTDDADMAQEALSAARVAAAGLVFTEWADVEQLWARWAPNFRLDIDRFVSVEGAQECFDTVMRFDRVMAVDADTLRIHDTKTHWAITPAHVLENSWQSAMYLAAARTLYPGWRRYQMVYEFIRYGVTSDVIEKSDAELDVIEQAIRESDEAMAQAEASGKFPATGGHHCHTCTLAATTCPLVQHVCVDSPQEAVGAIAAHERARAVHIDRLRAHVDANGPVEAGGVEWAHRPKTRTEYPALAVLDILTAHELPKAQFRLSATAVKPILTTRKYAAVREQVAAQGIVKPSVSVFSGKAVSPDEDAEPQEAE